MTEKLYPMTLEGKAKLEAELEELKVVKRKEIVERIKIARSYGDLSENSEYESAKDEQAFVEGRITTLEKMIRFAEIIDDNNVEKDVVSLGRKIAKGIIGKKLNDEVVIQTPGGDMKVKITKIESV